jgi:hypothetical protein
MATVDDAVRAALAAVETDAGFVRALRWSSERYRELTSRSRFRCLREVGELYVPAVIRTGLATATRDSQVVTGDATAQTAWTQEDLVGRWIRLKRVWYRIGAKVASGATIELRLETKFAEDNQAGVTYKIAQRFTKLDPRSRHLGSFVWMRFGRELEPLTMVEADIQFPDRLTVTSGGPYFIIETGTADDGTREVEIYPYPDKSEVFHYVFWPHTPDLKPGDSLPEPIDAYALREGVLIDIYRYEMSKSLRRGKPDEAGYWRNEARAQVSSWEQAIRDVGQSDKGLDDVTLVLRAGTHRMGTFGRPNNNAHSEIFIRGNRP